MLKLLIKKMDSVRMGQLRHREQSAITGCNAGIETAEMMQVSPLVLQRSANPPHIGTIIGKAMESLEEGEGTIMVFVTRQ